MIVVFGSVNVDLVARVGTIPKPGETVLAPGYVRQSGGKGANQAVAAARAGASVAMAGAVGRDAFGGEEAEALAREGIDISALARVEEPTGCAFITVSAEGENAITVASGANRLADAGSIDALLGRRPSCLLMQMELPLEPTLAAARAARHRGVPVVANLAPVPVDLVPEALGELLSCIDILVVNEHELADTARLLGLREPTPEKQILAVARGQRLTVVATLGADGAMLAKPGRDEVQRFAAPPIRPVDTTGAGDTLCGVLAAALDAGLSLPEAVRRAVAAGSLSCLDFGARTAMPRAEAIDAALAQAA
ncbi:ribokinase [Aureimonas sp. AU4]|uniref:ribokinase n=1 Tax=Aureimonas sp. AU4 TaxID=1638163 RepID=UPI0007864496|nr:ribokinase [Aureimonas sp. AU4]